MASNILKLMLLAISGVFLCQGLLFILPSSQRSNELIATSFTNEKYFRASPHTASSLDPYITISDAMTQVPSISHTRRIEENRLEKLIQEFSTTRFSNERIVNTNLLNRKLDEIAPF